MTDIERENKLLRLALVAMMKKAGATSIIIPPGDSQDIEAKYRIGWDDHQIILSETPDTRPIEIRVWWALRPPGGWDVTEDAA